MLEDFATLMRRSNYAAQFCGERELEHLCDSDDRVVDAAKIFATKEAIGKAFGTGLISSFWFDDIDVELGRAGSICVAISEAAVNDAVRRFGVKALHLHTSCCVTHDFVSVTCILQGELFAKQGKEFVD